MRRAYTIPDSESLTTARDLLRKEGVLAGSSSGTLVAAALRYCREQTTPKRVVTFVCDSGNKYLSKMFNDYWMADQGLRCGPTFGDLRDLIVRRFADGGVVSIGPDDPLHIAYSRMRLYDVSQLPVLENARVVGVVTDAGNFEAPATIDASGINSLIARRAGLTRWDLNKLCLGMKYIYRVDPDVLRERMQTYWDTDGVEVDWGCTHMLVGVHPDFYCAHATGMPGKDGIVSIAFYGGLKEMVKYRINIHQRAQWYLNQATCKRLIEGGEFIYFDIHMLAAGDMAGYVPKSYLPGLLLVGDAGGFADPPINFGANVAMWQGRMAAELCAEMKEKKDYSEAMFAQYEKNWRDSFVGENDIHQFCQFWRDGSFERALYSLDDVIGGFFRGYFKNTSYPSLLLGAIPKLLMATPELTKAGGILGSAVAGVGVNKASGLLQMLQMLGVDTDK